MTAEIISGDRALLRNFKPDDPLWAGDTGFDEGLGFGVFFSSGILVLALSALLSDSMRFEASSSWMRALSVPERTQTQASSILKSCRAETLSTYNLTDFFFNSCQSISSLAYFLEQVRITRVESICKQAIQSRVSAQ